MAEKGVPPSRDGIYGSPVTLEKISGVRAAMAELATKPFAIVNRDEILAFKDGVARPARLLTQEPQLKTLVDLPESGRRLKHFFETAVAPDIAAQIMANEMGEQREPTDQDYQDLAGQLIESDSPVARRLNEGAGQGVGLLRDIDHSASGADIISVLTGIEAKYLKNLPGTAQDGATLLRLHESRHFAQLFTPGTGEHIGEVDSDLAMMDGYMKAMARGLPLDPAMPEFMVKVREAGSFGGTGTDLHRQALNMAEYPGLPKVGEYLKTNALPTHATQFYLTGEPLDAHTNEEFSAMRRASSVVNVMIGVEEAQRVMRGYADLTPDDPRVSEFTATYLGDNSIYRLHDLGVAVSAGDASRKYNAIIALREAGYYPAGSEEAACVDRINQFLQTHAPEYLQDDAHIEARNGMIVMLRQNMEQPSAPAPEAKARNVSYTPGLGTP